MPSPNNPTQSQIDNHRLAAAYKMSDFGRGRTSPSAYPLLLEASKYPEYMKMMNYLGDANAVPNIAINKYMDSYGEYHHPTFNDPRGSIYMLSDGKTGTLMHELTHAVDTQIDDQAWRIHKQFQRTPEQKNFYDAYGKLKDTLVNPIFGDRNLPSRRIQLASMLGSQWQLENNDYRSTTPELAGFAIGNSVVPDRAYREGPPHLDATLATEFMTLLDLAHRAILKKSNK